MQTTFNFSFRFFFCLSLILWTGCGNTDGTAIEKPPTLTPADQAEVDKILAAHGNNAIIHYLTYGPRGNGWGRTVSDRDVENISKYIRYFVSQGANVNATDKDGNTSLHVATGSDDIEVIKCLVSQGADVNAKGQDGKTPLHVAATDGNIEVVKFLVSQGADVTVTFGGWTPWTPLDAARDKGHSAVVEYFALTYARMLAEAVDLFTMDVGRPPTTEEGLAVLSFPPRTLANILPPIAQLAEQMGVMAVQGELQGGGGTMTPEVSGAPPAPPPPMIALDTWNGPYIQDRTIVVDPWGNEYRYSNPGRNKRAFDIWSIGPDGIDGTADDIGHWMSEK